MGKHSYIFEADDIENCYYCPLFYDYIYCEIDLEDKRDYEDYTDSDDGHRPDWCPLREIVRCKMNRVKMFPGTDSDFVCWICSACGKTNNEHKPNYCPNCGAKVVNDER